MRESESSGGSETDAGHDAHDWHDPLLDVLPTGRARAAGVAAIVAGVAFIVIGAQFALFAKASAPSVPVPVPVEWAVAAITAGYFSVGWGMLGGRAWSAFAGVAVSFIGASFVTYLFLSSGAVSCVVAGSPVAFSVVLSVLGAGDVRRMSRARSALFNRAI
jgi:hypothetical protein